MMNSVRNSSERAADLCNDPDLELEIWINELYTNGFRDPLMNFGLDLMDINPHCASDQPNMSVNSGSIFGGGSADKSQSGIPQEMMTVSSLTPNSSTSTLQTSAGHILSPVPKFVSNPASQSSQSSRTTDFPQFTNQNQPLKHKAVQQPPTHPSIMQSTIMFGQQRNNQRMASEHLRPCPRPVSTIQTIHLQNQQTPRQQISNTSQLQQRPQHQMVHPLQNFQQNQNPTPLQFQQPAGTSHILIPEGGQHRVQGLTISQGQRKPQEHRQGNISAVLLAPVGFLHPNEFSSYETWREYAFRQISLMRDIYIHELLKMHSRAVYLYSQEKNLELVKKYDNAKEFLGKMLTFLNMPEVDMMPKNKERVYNYMNFIVNYLTSFRNKNGGFLHNFDQIINQQPGSQSNRPRLQPNGDMRLQYNPPANLSQGVVNLETNMVNFNQSASTQKGPQMHPSGDMKLQYMPPPNSSQAIANREATMMNFNQNFPSRRPQGRMPSPLSNGSFQMGTAGNPIRIGSFKGAQPNVLGTTQRSNVGPKTSSVNVSSSSMSLLKAATAANFPSHQANHQPSQKLVNQSFNSEKMKQPMHKSNDQLTGSNVGQVMSPLESLFHNSPQFSPLQSNPKPIILQPAGQHSVSSWQVNANSVLSPQSIARSPFLLGSSSAPSHHEKQYSSSGLSSVSAIESQRPEIPIIAGLFRNQKSTTNQVSDMGPPRTPTASPMDSTPCTEKSVVSQDSKDPHLRLLEAVKSFSSKALGSSMISINSVQQDLNSIPDHGEPTKPVGGEIENTTNFLLKHDNMEKEGRFDSTYESDDEPANLDHLNIGEETAFLFAHENYEPERKLKRKLTSASHSLLPDFGDDDSFDQFFSEEWGLDSTVTSMKKKSKIECKKEAIMEEIKDINSKLLETSLEMVVNPAEDSNSRLEGHEGIKVTILYRNVCFPDLFRPQAGVSSKMRPEFRIKLLVPINYPASSPTILKGSHYNVLSAPWPQLYDETVSKFHRAVRELPEPMPLGDMARNWDACARSVITDFVQQRGGKSFSIKYGSWESSSGSK